jgi:hypothetical protein
MALDAGAAASRIRGHHQLGGGHSRGLPGPVSVSERRPRGHRALGGHLAGPVRSFALPDREQAEEKGTASHYALAFFPAEGTAEIERFRLTYDPTARLIDAHLPLVFPLPESVGKDRLLRHCRRTLGEVEPFTIRPDGFIKARDHWLLLQLADDDSRLPNLYSALHSDLLASYARPDLFTPHIGLGLFLQPGSVYDWDAPSPKYDEDAYKRALREARTLNLPPEWLLDRLELVELPDRVLDWATGREPELDPELRAKRRLSLPLGGG